MSLKEDEKKLDAEFERMGLEIVTYHFTKGVEPLKAITIVDHTHIASKKLAQIIKGMMPTIRKDPITGLPRTFGFGALARMQLQDCGLYGVAICDGRDNFSRIGGRVRAKGRLLKHLKEQQQE